MKPGILRKLSLAVFSAALLATPKLAVGAVDIFLDLEGIPGDSLDQAHKGAIDVLAYSSGVTSNADGSGPAVTVSARDVTITKFVDRASVPLLKAATTGKPIPGATFTFRRVGADQFEFYEVTFSSVVVTGVTTGANGESDLEKERPIEFVTLRPVGEISWKYTPQKKDGSADTPLEGSYTPLKP